MVAVHGLWGRQQDLSRVNTCARLWDVTLVPLAG
jgi:hypothetical protein